MSHLVTNLAQLESLYGVPVEASIVKETDRVIPASRGRR
jgi:hypothetical protein